MEKKEEGEEKEGEGTKREREHAFLSVPQIHLPPLTPVPQTCSLCDEHFNTESKYKLHSHSLYISDC